MCFSNICMCVTITTEEKSSEITVSRREREKRDRQRYYTLIFLKKKKAFLKNSWFLKIFPHSCLLIIKLFLRHGLCVSPRLTVIQNPAPVPKCWDCRQADIILVTTGPFMCFATKLILGGYSLVNMG